MRYINAALRKSRTASRLHTKAYLKMLDEKKEEALELAQEAEKLAKKEGKDLSMYTQLVMQLKS